MPGAGDGWARFELGNWVAVNRWAARGGRLDLVLRAYSVPQIDPAEEFAEISRRGQSQLKAEGWHHTTTASVEVVQEGPDKAHCALINHRCHADGTVYHKFDTLWIITNQDGHWGVKFRSSFLASASH